MELSYPFSFVVSIAADEEQAREFVRNVQCSLRYAEVLKELRLSDDEPQVISAALPVSVALFGQHALPFASALHHTERGARLEPLPVTTTGPGTAEIGGTASVRAATGGSEVDYAFVIRIKLDLPEGGKWGEKALLKMVRLTALAVVRSVAAGLQPAVARAAAEFEPLTSRRRTARRSLLTSPR